MALPTLAITVRRLHDLDKSGLILFFVLLPLVLLTWFMDILEIIWFIPILGPMFIFPLLTKNGDAGENTYGPDPKNDK